MPRPINGYSSFRLRCADQCERTKPCAACFESLSFRQWQSCQDLFLSSVSATEPGWQPEMTVRIKGWCQDSVVAALHLKDQVSLA